MMITLNPVPADRFVTIEYEGPLTSGEKNLHRTCDFEAAGNWITACFTELEGGDPWIMASELATSMVEFAWAMNVAVEIHAEEDEKIWIFPGFQGQLPGKDPDMMEFRLDEDWMSQVFGVDNWERLVQL